MHSPFSLVVCSPPSALTLRCTRPFDWWCAQRLGVQIEIAETHGFPALPNKSKEVLTAEEKHTIETVAKVVMKHHYRPVGSDEVMSAHADTTTDSELREEIADSELREADCRQ